MVIDTLIYKTIFDYLVSLGLRQLECEGDSVGLADHQSSREFIFKWMKGNGQGLDDGDRHIRHPDKWLRFRA